MQFTVFITLLASLVALVSAYPQVQPDSTSTKETKGDCGIVGFTRPGEFSQVTKDVPLDPAKRILPYRVELLDCFASCKRQLGAATPDGKGCQTVMWDLKFGHCGFSSTPFDSNINRDKRGSDLFYKPDCYAEYKDGKSSFPVIAPGQE